MATKPASDPQSSDGAAVGKCPACKSEGVRLRDVNGLLICERCSSKRFSSKVRKSIQEAFERQQDQKQKEAWTKRIDVARKGVKLYELGKHADALRAFRDYITILESRHSVGHGGLHINLFDPKKDAGEILLIAGIFWDMAKIYDHMKGHNAELRGCLNKFIEFSIGKNHVILASEAIRKYIASGMATNVQDFKNAHQTVLKYVSKCFIATAVFGPDSAEVALLRRFRDEMLSMNRAGQTFIKAYYRLSPPLARMLVRNSRASGLFRRPLELLTKIISKTLRS